MFKTRFKKFPINHHYCNRYLTFISNCIDHNMDMNVGQYLFTEKHHVLPRYLFPSYIKSTWNLIALTPRQHFIAHLILTKVFLGQEKYGAIMALNMMKDNIKNSRLYEQCKITQSNYMKINNPMFNRDVVEKMKASLAKFYASDEGIKYRQNMSKNRKGKNNISDEGRKKLSELWTGVARPKSKDHIERNIISQSMGIFHTPFGDFYSPNQAMKSTDNPNLSRFSINKYCKNNINGFSFTSFDKEYKTGQWKRPT